MDRRRFLQTALASAAAANALSAPAQQTVGSSPASPSSGTVAVADISVAGHMQICTFTRAGETWTVYEDLRTREGSLSFLCSTGIARVLRKNAEATFADDGPQHLGLDIKDIGMSGPDLLADRLLAQGEPQELEVRAAAPPMNSHHDDDPQARPGWNTIVGTRECSDTMPVYPSGSTRTYHPVQYFKELTQARANQRFEGLIGGWMPAVRKVFPEDGDSYYEVVVFGDVLATDRFIVQTWHRTVHVNAGRIAKVEYGYSYPAYTRRRQEPSAEEFFRGMLEFAEYWERQTADMTSMTLPDPAWTDMVRYAFVKEQIVRPGGTYPKYGAVDRDYYGPEYDGFQDIFTMSLYANLECGRLEMARAVLDGYFTDFVDDKGIVNMRGPETAQFGLTLFLLAHYYDLTGDRALLLKHRNKIEATATLLLELQDESLKLPVSDRGYGLIHGWCESDACLFPDPSIWWKPYYANSAFAVRGWRELARLWRTTQMPDGKVLADTCEERATQLQQRLLQSLENNIKRDLKPPYVPLLPGSPYTFRESLEKEKPSEQGWSHRCYTELLQANVLPPEMANAVIDTMRAYGATTAGVVANVERPNPEDRAILGFVSYGYAQMLLRLDRIDEYILFLYTHRYHDHSRGSWTAGEVSGLTGGGALFCIPAQQTIPLLVRWMLVFDEGDEQRLHCGRALPRAWVGSGKRIAIEDVPTRYGRVSYQLDTGQANLLSATVRFTGNAALPREVYVHFRAPLGKTLQQILVNGRAVIPSGRHSDAAVFKPDGERSFTVLAHLA